MRAHDGKFHSWESMAAGQRGLPNFSELFNAIRVQKPKMSTTKEITDDYDVVNSPAREEKDVTSHTSDRMLSEYLLHQSPSGTQRLEYETDEESERLQNSKKKDETQQTETEEQTGEKQVTSNIDISGDLYVRQPTNREHISTTESESKSKSETGSQECVTSTKAQMSVSTSADESTEVVASTSQMEVPTVTPEKVLSGVTSSQSVTPSKAAQVLSSDCERPATKMKMKTRSGSDTSTKRKGTDIADSEEQESFMRLGKIISFAVNLHVINCLIFTSKFKFCKYPFVILSPSFRHPFASCLMCNFRTVNVNIFPFCTALFYFLHM